MRPAIIGRISPTYWPQPRIANPVGIVLVTTGGGGGTWQRIDENFNAFTPPAGYFDNHKLYKNIVNETVDSQAMVKVPKYYFKTGLVPSGTYAGKRYWMVAENYFDGATVHPAFLHNGSEIDKFYVGKYQATADGGTKLGSAASSWPIRLSLSDARTKAAARNTGGVTGFAVWDVYQWAAIMIAALIEVGTANFQTAIGNGNTYTWGLLQTSDAIVAQATWRNIVGLWGNVFQWLDGLFIDSSYKIQVFDRSGNRTTKTTSVTPATAGEFPVTMSTASGDGYDLSDMFIPATTDYRESYSTFPDIWVGAGNCSAAVGGYYQSLTGGGPFNLRINQNESSALPYFGTRISKI